MAAFSTKQRTIFPDREAKKFRRFKFTFKGLLIALKRRLEEEKDAFALVTGDTGSGKSHFVGNMCLGDLSEADNFITGEGKIFQKSNFIVDPGELAVKMLTEKGSALWIDEGRDAVNRQKWFSEINQVIASRKNRNRKNFNLYFLLMPYETEVDPKIMKHIHLWIWVRRGVAEVYCKTSGMKGGSGLDIQRILDREARWRKENPKAHFVIPYIHPEFIGRIFFSKLSEEKRKIYEKLVNEKHAIGELTEEEKLEYGIVEKLSPETYIRNTLRDLMQGKIEKSKSFIWDKLKTETELPDDQLLKKINFYLNLEGMKTFNRLFSENTSRSKRT